MVVEAGSDISSSVSRKSSSRKHYQYLELYAINKGQVTFFNFTGGREITGKIKLNVQNNYDNVVGEVHL